jgi:hypothetical protein
MSPVPSNTETTSSGTKACPWYQPLCNVTPLSKYLAMVIFILMPFVGAYVGYEYALTNESNATDILVTSSKSVPQNQNTSTLTDLGDVNVPVIISVTANSVPLVDIKKSTSTIRVATKESIGEYFDEGTNFVNFTTLDNIAVNGDISYVTNLPFLTILATTSDLMFLTAHCLKGTECSFANLYELNLQNSILREMTVSKLYDETHSGSFKLRDSLFVVTSPYFSTSSDLFVIDLESDTPYKLDSLDKNSDRQSSFCVPGLGCELDVNLLAEKEIEVVIYTAVDINTPDYRIATSAKQYTW